MQFWVWQIPYFWFKGKLYAFKFKDSDFKAQLR